MTTIIECVAKAIEEAGPIGCEVITEDAAVLLAKAAIEAYEAEASRLPHLVKLINGERHERTLSDLSFLHEMPIEDLELVISLLTKDQLDTLRKFLFPSNTSLGAGTIEQEPQCRVVAANSPHPVTISPLYATPQPAAVAVPEVAVKP